MGTDPYEHELWLKFGKIPIGPPEMDYRKCLEERARKQEEEAENSAPEEKPVDPIYLLLMREQKKDSDEEEPVDPFIKAALYKPKNPWLEFFADF